MTSRSETRSGRNFAPKRSSRWGSTLAGGAVFAALVLGALLGSLGVTEIRAALVGREPRLQSVPTPGAETDEETDSN